MKKVWLLLLISLSVCCYSSTALAADGLDKHKSGFGPEIFGFQLGQSVKVLDFVEMYLRFIESTDSPIECLVRFEVYDSSGQKLRGKLDVTLGESDWEVSSEKSEAGVLAGLLTTKGGLAELVNSGEAITAKNTPAIVTVFSRFGYVSALRRSNDRPFRYSKLTFGKTAFAPQNTKPEVIVKWAVGEFKLGDLQPIGNGRGWMSDPVMAQKNGWLATFELQDNNEVDFVVQNCLVK
ncbi:MAG: hypothetical protein LBQ58_09830 [Synergistaceae bacterium]|nr:hypothetical protein [Synergistaceae bacterium]